MRRVLLTLACVAAAGLTGVRLAAQDEGLDALQEKAIKAAVKRVAPYVVTIETQGGTDLIVAGGPRGARILKGTGPTTGLIVAPDGHIVTSAFNFANKPSSIFVAVPGQKEKFVGKVIATDQTRMLTLLKVDATNLPVPPAAPKDKVRVGHTALAVGRTLAQDIAVPPSVSQGIVSAVGRIWGKAIQTDAKVSPTNYGGPLIDLEGRVIGVLVPASPNSEGETAGYEWYDSGIGFAIPLEDINRILPRLKAGKDVKKGVLGVTMRGRDIYGEEPVIATVSPGSAAEAAGIKPGDVIKAIDGKEVQNYAQVQHQLGSKYEGDPVSVTVLRGKETVKVDKVALGGAVAAFNQPFLGILPMRDDPDNGVLVRHVFARSPAAEAGIKEGDRIAKAGPDARALRAVNNPRELATLLAPLRPGVNLVLEVVPRGGKAKNVTVKVGEYVDAVPAKLPEEATLKRARGGAAPKKDDKKEEKKDEDEAPKIKTGLIKRMNAARDREFWLYVPENYDPDVSHALLLWLHPVGKNKETDMEAITDRWADYCSDHRLIMVCPKSENQTGWVASEAEHVTEAVRAALDGYTIDRRRVVAHGMGVGGQMAFYLGFAARDQVRGVATTGAVLTSNPKERVPTQPLSFYVVVGEKDPIKDAVKASQEKLLEHKYPTLYREMKEKGHQYYDLDTEDMMDELVRWIDSLDRI